LTERSRVELQLRLLASNVVAGALTAGRELSQRLGQRLECILLASQRNAASFFDQRRCVSLTKR
jgi:hypothetical protein